MKELQTITPETLSKLALNGDVAGLNPIEKVQYYKTLCNRVGLDPATQPFKLMSLNGKQVFYLDRSGAQQLNRVHQISHAITGRDFVNGCYVVTARASIGTRFTDSLGSVATDGLKGEALANATMKAETKAKRRATLDLVGLGMLDEMEVETIPNVARVELPAVKQPQIQSQNDSGTFDSASPMSSPSEANKVSVKPPQSYNTYPDWPDGEVELIATCDSFEQKNITSKKNNQTYLLTTIHLTSKMGGRPFDVTTFKVDKDELEVLQGQDVLVKHKPDRNKRGRELVNIQPHDEIQM